MSELATSYIRKHCKYNTIFKKNILALKKVQGQSEARLKATKKSDIKEGQEDKTFVFLIYCDRNDNILTTIDFVTWPPLQIMPDSTKRWPSD